jgi:hypothetical protein
MPRDAVCGPTYEDPIADEVAAHIAESRGQVRWEDTTVKKVQPLGKSILRLGHGHYFSVEEESNGTCWLYASLNWFSGGHFVACTPDEGKAMVRQMMIDDLERSLAILKGAQ